MGAGDPTVDARPQPAPMTTTEKTMMRFMRAVDWWVSLSKLVEGGVDAGECLVRRRTGRGKMAHFPSGARFFFSVQVQTYTRFAKNAFELRWTSRPEITEQIHDSRRPHHA